MLVKVLPRCSLLNQIFLMKTLFNLFAVCLIGSLIYSCKGEPIEVVVVERIQGNWKVIDAYRNKRQTKLLNNAFVSITDTSFMTNIPPNEGFKKYTYNSNKIVLLNDENTTYRINSIQGDTIRMSTEIQDFNFDLVLAKSNETDEK